MGNLVACSVCTNDGLDDQSTSIGDWKEKFWDLEK